MIGIIPSTTKTFEVFGFFDAKELIDDKLYVDPADNRVYMYSLTKKRSNPDTGYFPVWDGKSKYVTKYSNEKYLGKDVTRTDLSSMSLNISKEVANQVLANQRRSDNDEILTPQLSDGDNMFTQCVKGIILAKQYTMMDLLDMCQPKLDEKVIHNYYTALMKITFMRLDKWQIWIDNIFHMKYSVTVFKDDKKLLSYHHPKNIFDTGIVKYDSITKTNDDPFKKIIKILMVMENINKNSLRSKEIDDYTINNMLTTLNSKKSLSSQLFSRFIRMANLSYDVHIFEGEELIFEYRES